MQMQIQCIIPSKYLPLPSPTCKNHLTSPHLPFLFIFIQKKPSHLQTSNPSTSSFLPSFLPSFLTLFFTTPLYTRGKTHFSSLPFPSFFSFPPSLPRTTHGNQRRRQRQEDSRTGFPRRKKRRGQYNYATPRHAMHTLLTMYMYISCTLGRKAEKQMQKARQSKATQAKAHDILLPHLEKKRPRNAPSSRKGKKKKKRKEKKAPCKTYHR